MEGGAVALLRPKEKLAPEQLLLEPLGALIGALAGLVLEQHLPNAAHRKGPQGQKGRELRGELRAHQAVAADLVVAQAIGAATEVLEPGQGRGLIAPEGEGAAGVALGIPVGISQGIGNWIWIKRLEPLPGPGLGPIRRKPAQAAEIGRGQGGFGRAIQAAAEVAEHQGEALRGDGPGLKQPALLGLEKPIRAQQRADRIQSCGGGLLGKGQQGNAQGR